MSVVKRLALGMMAMALLAVTLSACSGSTGGAGSAGSTGASEPTGTGDAAEPKSTDVPAVPAPLALPTTGPSPDRPRVPASRLGGAATGTLPVDSVDVVVTRSQPVQVNVEVRGNLPDSCTKRAEVTQDRTGNAFVITITTTRPAGAICTQVLTPFQESIPLDVTGLKAGPYTVTVNGAGTTFELPGS